MKIKPTKIPYKSSVEKLSIQTKEERKGNKVEFDKNFIYSYPGKRKKSLKFDRYIDSGAARQSECFECKNCDTQFKIASLRDIQHAVCPSCGGVELKDLNSRDERLFERLLK